MELILAALPERWGLLALGAALAGLVRGFSGFGTAMIFLPFAGMVVPPFVALTLLVVVDLIGPVPTLPRALREGDVGDILRLGVGALLAVPVGVFILSFVSPEGFRWAVSTVTLVLLVMLILGVRYRGAMTRPLVYGTGALGGVLTGAVGVPGPPVIMLYMASDKPVSMIRANLSLYLVVADLILLGVLAVSGWLETSALLLGVLLIPFYVLANLAGAAIFSPDHAGGYRSVAYGMIACAAILGLPIWG